MNETDPKTSDKVKTILVAFARWAAENREPELLDVDAVAREWQDVLRQVRAGMLTVTAGCGVGLPHLTAHDAGVLDREIRDALTALGDDAEAR